MGGFYDIYVLSADRTRSTIDRFLARFAPQREESASEYTVPQYSPAPTSVCGHDYELIEYCEVHPHETQAVYWRNLAAVDPAHVMVFFTPDAAVIFGLSVTGDPQQWLDMLLKFAKSDCGYFDFEQPPPSTSAEFRATSKRMRDG